MGFSAPCVFPHTYLLSIYSLYLSWVLRLIAFLPHALILLSGFLPWSSRGFHQLFALLLYCSTAMSQLHSLRLSAVTSSYFLSFGHSIHSLSKLPLYCIVHMLYYTTTANYLHILYSTPHRHIYLPLFSFSQNRLVFCLTRGVLRFIGGTAAGWQL